MESFNWNHSRDNVDRQPLLSKLESLLHVYDPQTSVDI